MAQLQGEVEKLQDEGEWLRSVREAEMEIDWWSLVEPGSALPAMEMGAFAA